MVSLPSMVIENGGRTALIYSLRDKTVLRKFYFITPMGGVERGISCCSMWKVVTEIEGHDLAHMSLHAMAIQDLKRFGT